MQFTKIQNESSFLKDQLYSTHQKQQTVGKYYFFTFKMASKYVKQSEIITKEGEIITLKNTKYCLAKLDPSKRTDRKCSWSRKLNITNMKIHP